MSDRNVNININGKNNAGPAIDSVGRSVDSLTTKLGGLKAAFGAFIGMELIRRTAGSIMETAEMMDEVGKASDRIGMATESLLSLKWAADQSGVSFESLDKSLVKMSRNLSEVARGGGTAVAKSLADIGLSANQLMSLSPEEQFNRIADGLNALPNQADKIRVAMDIFGKAGADLIPLLAEGSEGLREFRKEAEEMGILFSREDAARIEEFNDQINKMNTSLGALKITLLGMAAPDVTTGAKIITDIINGTQSIEKDVFGAVLKMDMRYLDVRDVPHIKKQLEAEAYTPEQIEADLRREMEKNPLLAKQIAENGGVLGNEANEIVERNTALRREKQQLAIDRMMNQFKFGRDTNDEDFYKTEEGFEETKKELPKLWEGLKGGMDSLVGAAKSSTYEIVKDVPKSIDDAFEARTRARVAAIDESVKTPRERLMEGLREVDRLSRNGLGAENARRQRLALVAQFAPNTETSLASREFRALQRAPGASGPEVEAARDRKSQLRVAEESLKALKAIESNVKNTPPPLTTGETTKPANLRG